MEGGKTTKEEKGEDHPDEDAIHDLVGELDIAAQLLLETDQQLFESLVFDDELTMGAEDGDAAAFQRSFGGQDELSAIALDEILTNNDLGDPTNDRQFQPILPRDDSPASSSYVPDADHRMKNRPEGIKYHQEWTPEVDGSGEEDDGSGEDDDDDLDSYFEKESDLDHLHDGKDDDEPDGYSVVES